MGEVRYDRESRDRIKEYARLLRRKTTGAEYHLKTRLRKQGERKILRQCVVGRMILDLGLPFRNLLIEVDDPSHEEKKDRDARRDVWLKNLGFNVVRFKDEEVFNQPEEVLDQIRCYEASEENRTKFYMSLRAARAKSYWVEDLASEVPMD